MAERTGSPVKRFFAWLLALPVLAGAILFALANHGTLALDFWPLPYTVSAPIFLVLFGAILAGFIAGGIVAWFTGRKRRAEARRQAKELERVRRERDELQTRLAAAEQAPGAGAESDTARRQLVVADS